MSNQSSGALISHRVKLGLGGMSKERLHIVVDEKGAVVEVGLAGQQNADEAWPIAETTICCLLEPPIVIVKSSSFLS